MKIVGRQKNVDEALNQIYVLAKKYYKLWQLHSMW